MEKIINLITRIGARLVGQCQEVIDLLKEMVKILKELQATANYTSKMVDAIEGETDSTNRFTEEMLRDFMPSIKEAVGKTASNTFLTATIERKKDSD